MGADIPWRNNQGLQAPRSEHEGAPTKIDDLGRRRGVIDETQ
jgi:hypothetical protein